MKTPTLSRRRHRGNKLRGGLCDGQQLHTEAPDPDPPFLLTW